MSDLEVEIIRARAHYAANRIIEDGVPFEDSHEDFDELIAQVRKEAKAEALRDAAERLRAGNLMIGPNYIDPCDAADWLEHRATSNYLNDRADHHAHNYH